MPLPVDSARARHGGLEPLGAHRAGDALGVAAGAGAGVGLGTRVDALDPLPQITDGDVVDAPVSDGGVVGGELGR